MESAWENKSRQGSNDGFCSVYASRVVFAYIKPLLRALLVYIPSVVNQYFCIGNDTRMYKQEGV